MKRLGLLSIIVLTLLALMPGAVGVHAQEAEGSVEPPTGGPGTTFTFRASGFNSSEQMGIWLVRPDGETRRLGEEVADNRRFADADGNLEWTWTATELSPGGPWIAVARGDVSRVEVRIPFTVQNNLGNAPPYSWFVDPASGPPGTTFTFVGRSPEFIPGEQVGSWFIMPNGETLNVEQGMSVDPNGQIFRLWKAPEDIGGGEWVFRAVGISSGYNIDMRFYIEAPEAPPAPEVPQILEAAPVSGPPGTTFSFTANGFASGELVSNWLVRPDEQSLDAASYIRADNEGVLTWQWTAPPDTPAGQWEWRLSGTQRPGHQAVPFTIEGNIPIPPPPDVPPGTVEPASGPPDTPFYFAAEGFTPGENVFFWPENADGEPLIQEGTVQADANGRASWRWDVPSDARPGQWHMAARGKVSSVRAYIPFSVTPPDYQEPLQGVSQSYGAPGVTLEFFGNEYNSGELLDIWTEGPEGSETYRIADVTANRHGHARWKWTIPDDALEGEWVMVARGFDSRELRTIQYTVSRLEPPKEEKPYGVDPYRGAPGTTFNFYAEGFADGDLIGYWLTMPDGTVIRTNDIPEKEADEKPADGTGRFELSWTAPEDAQRGIWQLSMQPVNPESIEKDLRYTIQFIIE